MEPNKDLIIKARLQDAINTHYNAVLMGKAFKEIGLTDKAEACAKEASDALKLVNFFEKELEALGQ